VSWKRTILAALTLLTLALAFVLDRQITDKRVYMTVNQQSLSPGINASEVEQIAIRNQDGEALLVRENGKWRLKKPVDAAADPEIVEQLLVNVTGARKRNENEVKNLAEFGLASPEVALTLKTSTGKTFDLLLGNESTYTGQVFAKYRQSPEVFTVGEQVRSVLLRRPIDFRRARLMDIDVADLDQYQSVSINTPDKAIVLRNEHGNWRVESPFQGPAENSIVHDYLRKLGLLRASGFLSENSDKPTSVGAAMLALAKPTLSLTLERGNGPVTRLLIAETGETSHPVYVAQRMGDDEFLVLRRETIDSIQQDENYFRSRSLFSLPYENIAMFSIEIGRARTDLIKNDAGQWEFVGDPNRRVDQEQVQVRLEALLHSRIQDYVDASPHDLNVYGLQPPMMRFSILNKDKSLTEGIDTGRAQSGHLSTVYAKRRGDPAVFTIELSSELFIVPERVADRKFARTHLSLVDHFDIIMDEKRYTFKKEGEWKLLRPTQTAFSTIDAAKLERVLQMLNEIEYDKDFSANGETVIAGSETPQLEIHLFAKGDEELLSMTVGKRMENSSFVTTGKSHTYEVLNSELDRLMAAIQSLLQ
jgi:hypothetical protein